MREVKWPYPTSDEVSHLACMDVEVLRARIDQLLEERHELKAQVEYGGDVTIPYRFNLTASERRLVECLARAKGMVTKERLHKALSGQSEPDTALKIVDVIICKARKKLKASGFPETIVTVWGQGFDLTPEMRAYLRQ